MASYGVVNGDEIPIFRLLHLSDRTVYLEHCLAGDL
jgi:hypothetical protein